MIIKDMYVNFWETSSVLDGQPAAWSIAGHGCPKKVPRDHSLEK